MYKVGLETIVYCKKDHKWKRKTRPKIAEGKDKERDKLT